MIEYNPFNASISRRDLMKVVGTATAVMGLPFAMSEKIAEAASNPDNRPPVIWLHFQECTGCSEAIMRATHPGPAELILNIINLCYQETLMAGSGHQAEKSLTDAMKKYAGKYILVVEGSIPKNENGIYCKIGGRTAIDILQDCAKTAMCVVTLGSCSTSGGIASIAPNPTGAYGAMEFLPATTPHISLPGCPPNPYNLLSCILYLITFNKLPEMDAQNRPLFAYGRLIHEHCERRAHFDAGRFVQKFGDQGHKDGWCLYKMGCKGPETHANCSTVKFNDGIAWPIGNGNPCIGCTEGHVLFQDSLFRLATVAQPTPGSNVPPATPSGLGVKTSATQAGVIGAAVGLAIGAGAIYAAKLPKEPEDENK